MLPRQGLLRHRRDDNSRTDIGSLAFAASVLGPSILPHRDLHLDTKLLISDEFAHAM